MEGRLLRWRWTMNERDIFIAAVNKPNAAERASYLVTTDDEPTLAERPGTVIGPYKLLEQIGEGGFGVVFMHSVQGR
jgi:hypothetical protein